MVGRPPCDLCHSSQGTEQFTHLAGIAAPAEYQNLVIYKVERCQGPADS
jgi:hypothetical protein